MPNKLKRLAIFDLDILQDILNHWDNTLEVEVDNCIYEVKTGSSRYKVFNRCLSCACCGLTGSKMALEQPDQHIGTNKAHFNLYAVNDNGTLVLMTRDHIQPVSQGGTNRLSNLQTYCSPCNNLKSNRLISNKNLLKEVIENRKTWTSTLAGERMTG